VIQHFSGLQSPDTSTEDVPIDLLGPKNSVGLYDPRYCCAKRGFDIYALLILIVCASLTIAYQLVLCPVRWLPCWLWLRCRRFIILSDAIFLVIASFAGLIATDSSSLTSAILSSIIDIFTSTWPES